jgi:hypothetical protein
MGITVIKLREGADQPMWTADRYLYKTPDGRIVEEGDKDSRFLYATPGYLIPMNEAIAYGLADPPDPPPSAREIKMQDAARNKQRKLRDKQQAEREALTAKQAEERARADQDSRDLAVGPQTKTAETYPEQRGTA